LDRLRVPAVLDSMDDVVRYVAELARRAGLSGLDTGRLRLATEELVVNVIVHGYGARRARHSALDIVGGVYGYHVWLRIVPDVPLSAPH